MDVWKQLQRRRVRPTPRIWNALLDGYGRAKNHAAALQTWSTAVKQGSTDSATSEELSGKLPDEQMYTTMINIHFRAKQVDEAMALLSDIKAKSDRSGGQLRVQVETFNAVLHGLFLNRMHAQAQGLLDEMISKGPAPNIGTINTFVRAHARVGDLQSLATTLRLADKLRLTPDIVTFTTVLDALLRDGGESATDAVVKTLGIMNDMGVQANVVTYTAMIKACLVGAEAAQLDLASQNLLGDADGRKYGRRSSNEARIEAALELLDRMHEAKVAPSEIAYSALIGGCLQNSDAVAHAFSTKALPDHYLTSPKLLKRLGETQQTMHQWFKNSPHISLTLLLLERMKGRGLSPTSTTFRFLIEGLCSPHTDQAAFMRSMDLIDDMLLRTPLSQPSRTLGPFALTTLKGEDALLATLHVPSFKTWITIFSSLIDRLENGPRDKVAVTTGARALNTAIRLVREMGSLSGAEGGMSLSRLVERAASLTSKLSR
uniref:Pentacotripeptide-repeat region of PRORP domain-containing protein n=2 Tax=Kalmanozyma brasiliensis (strain GHG001) TaxID=1365824 RepID=V5ETM0_KALBG